MKQSIFGLVLAFLVCAHVYAGPIRLLVKPLPAISANTNKDFENACEEYQNWVDNISKEDFYKDLKIVDNNTEIKFTSLSEFDKQMFYLYQSESLSNKMFELQEKWEKKIHAQKHGIANERNDVASVENIKEHIGTLLSVRKDHAIKFEALLDVSKDKLKGKVPDDEMNLYKKTIMEWHNEHKLIERKNAK